MNSELPRVAVVIPVLNEAHVLEGSVRTLLSFLRDQFPYPAHVLVAENGSTDGTLEIAERLSQENEDVEVIKLPVKGRGRALRVAWTESDADIVAYTDVDLSTELEALTPMCRAIHEQGYDISIGSRLMSDSKVTRSFNREFISRAYNMMIKAVHFTRFSDAQCGFKCLNREAVDNIVPLVEGQNWFFDTELLILAEKMGYRIFEVPVAWVEDPDSRVRIASTAWEDTRGLIRLKARLMRWAATPGPHSSPNETRPHNETLAAQRDSESD